MYALVISPLVPSTSSLACASPTEWLKNMELQYENFSICRTMACLTRLLSYPMHATPAPQVVSLIVWPLEKVTCVPCADTTCRGSLFRLL